MKKFISFVLAGAMVASLVPATAFAASGRVDATFKVIDALTLTKDEASAYKYIKDDHVGNVGDTDHYDQKVPELIIDINNADYRSTNPEDWKAEITLTLDNAELISTGTAYLKSLVTLYDSENDSYVAGDYAAQTPPSIAGGTGASFAPGGGTDYAAQENGEWVLKKQASDYTTITDNDDALAYLLEKGRTFVVANPSNAGKTFALNDGSSDVTVVEFNSASGATTGVYASTGAIGGGAWTDAKVAQALAAGWTPVSASGDVEALDIKVDVAAPGASASLQAITSVGNITDATQAAFDAQANGWTAGTWTPATAPSSVVRGFQVDVKRASADSVTFTINRMFHKDDYLIFDLESVLQKTGEGKQATVSVESDLGNADDLVYVTVGGRSITATTKKVGSIAEEETINLESELKIKSDVGNFVNNQWFEMKLSKGFEFSKFVDDNSPAITNIDFDGNTAYFQFVDGQPDSNVFTISEDDIEIESTSAKSGAVCTITVKALSRNWNGSELVNSSTPGVFTATATVEVLKVVDYKVMLTVDEDEDLPVIYSGVDVDNYGITDDSDHLSLEVTAKETFPGAWSMRKGFNFELPEGVYVTDVKVIDTDNFYWNKGDVDVNDVEAAFWNAYRDGSHVNFEFAKRVFDDVDNNLRDKECAEMTFQMELVADPGFEGDVALKLTGDLVDDQEVTIAKFVKPYEVKAEQNDLIIDYRYTEIPTNITLTEAEAGLWAKNEAIFTFSIEKDVIQFDSDPTYEIDSKSGLEIKDDKVNGGAIQFTIKTESDEAATITIKDMDLFMQRNIPAGPYALKIGSSLANAYEGQALFAPDQLSKAVVGDHSGIDGLGTVASTGKTGHAADCGHAPGVKADSYVGCVADYSKTVKEAFVNVVTAGRDVDDASFTTKVVVPVGESYIVAGEKQIELDTPAYINEAGYTMLPIRAVATALGINNNNVLWDQPTHTVTILYGQRIITMTQGQKVVYVNGSAIPASAAVENTNSRTFLPMRDLATALGVTDITWDQATRTATLNGNQK